MEDIEYLKKKLRKQLEKHFEVDDSDIPLHEKRVTQEHIKNVKKKQ